MPGNSLVPTLSSHRVLEDGYVFITSLTRLPRLNFAVALISTESHPQIHPDESNPHLTPPLNFDKQKQQIGFCYPHALHSKNDLKHESFRICSQADRNARLQQLL